MVTLKVEEINLEYGRPTVEKALQDMKNALITCKGKGCRAVILIHGYGSTGVGGAIRTAVRRSLGEPFLRGIVRAYTGGEHWVSRRRLFLDKCKALEDFERRISGNEGITVVLLQ